MTMNLPKTKANHKTSRKGGGFSTIELIITVTVITIVPGFGVLGITRANASIRLAGAAREYASYIEKGRILSIRSHADDASERSTIAINDNKTSYDITMDLAAHRVNRGGRNVHLGPTEFRLLEFFMLHPGRVFSREELLDAVWGPDIHVEPRTVDVHIRRLRQALGEPDLIRTVRSAGYALDAEGVA